MAYSDDLLKLNAAAAVTQALSTIQADTADAEQNLRQSLETGDNATAAMEMRRLADLQSQAQYLTGSVGGQQQQQQSQYTQAEIAVLQRHPSVMNDPRKMAELVGAADALIKQGYDRNSQQYASALETFLGGRNTAHTADAELTPDDVLKISSEKFKLTPDEYNANVNKLAQAKAQGRYR